jgi:hypothetical protein
MRDPRIDPKPGDILRIHGDIYRVISTDKGCVVDTPTRESHSDFGLELNNNIDAWRGFSFNAEIIGVADAS